MFSHRVLKITAQPFVQNEDLGAEPGNGEHAGEKTRPPAVSTAGLVSSGARVHYFRCPTFA